MSSEEFRQYLAKASEEYRRDLPGRLAEINATWERARAGAVDGDPLQELLRRLHTLAGSASTFGMPQVSAAARDAEYFLEPYCAGGALPDEQARRFAGMLDALARCAKA